jgi:hypothetical protein
MSRLAGNEWLGSALVMQAAIERQPEMLLALGFRPAFYDYTTGALHLSRRADGTPSTEYLVDGLPDEAVAVRSACGRVIAAKATLLAGYERGGFFYTRSTAWRWAKEWCNAA